VALSCGLLSVGLVLDPGPNARSGGATVRLERERISKESLGTTLGMLCDGRNDCLPAVRVASTAAWNSMATVISLREVIETLEMQGENCLSYLDPDTGEIVTATEEVRRLAEEPEESQDNLPEWQREMVRKVRAILASSRCLQLPDRFRIPEWSIMNEFAEAQHSNQVRQELLEAIHGAGAFRMFRSTIRRLGIEKSWYRFREEALAEIARDWLEAHELPYR
jgi:Uncharacterised protein family (UPF0158)